MSQNPNKRTSSLFGIKIDVTKKPVMKHPSQRDVGIKCDGSCVEIIEELKKQITQLKEELSDKNTYIKRKEIETAKQIAESEVNHKPRSSRSRLASKMKLSNWWKQRPTIETLKDQKIYQDEPCFDTELERTLKHEKYTTIPKIVVDCVDLIEEKLKNSPHPIEGLYRASGDYTKIQALRFSIDSNDYESLKSVTDIHTLTGLLKLFLREIKSPLVKTTEIKTFIGPSNQWLLKPMMTKIEILQNLVKTLPETNRDTLKYIFSHFYRITKVPKQNITSEVLAITITPSILHTVTGEVRYQDIHIVLKESEVYADCLKLLIDHSTKIFQLQFNDRRRRSRSFTRSLSAGRMVSNIMSLV